MLRGAIRPLARLSETPLVTQFEKDSTTNSAEQKGAPNERPFKIG
jgi:hypothetical protein